MIPDYVTYILAVGFIATATIAWLLLNENCKIRHENNELIRENDHLSDVKKRIERNARSTLRRSLVFIDPKNYDEKEREKRVEELYGQGYSFYPAGCCSGMLCFSKYMWIENK